MNKLRDFRLFIHVRIASRFSKYSWLSTYLLLSQDTTGLETHLWQLMSYSHMWYQKTRHLSVIFKRQFLKINPYKLERASNWPLTTYSFWRTRIFLKISEEPDTFFHNIISKQATRGTRPKVEIFVVAIRLPFTETRNIAPSTSSNDSVQWIGKYTLCRLKWYISHVHVLLQGVYLKAKFTPEPVCDLFQAAWFPCVGLRSDSVRFVTLISKF